MLLLGEVRTGLLQHSGALTGPVVDRVLGLLAGERVTRSHRPVALAHSPALVEGVDCLLPSASRARRRAVGTVAARAVLTGGHVVQGSVRAGVTAGADRRQPWAHYLARPGEVQSVGRLAADDVAAGYLAESANGSRGASVGGPVGGSVGGSVGAAEPVLDLGAVAERLIGRVQLHPELDHRIPLRARRSRLRWVATFEDGHADGRPPVWAEFTVHDEVLRTLRVRVNTAAFAGPDADVIADVQGFCENLALHDWVLTTLLNVVERSGLGSTRGVEAIAAVRPAIDHLLHLWMPGAHVADSMMPLWESLEKRPGFTRQWAATVQRIRDQLAAHTATAWSRPESAW
jgi:hypothetical protein